MRRKISLYIEGRLVDLNDDSLILYNYTLDNFANPTIVRNSYSQQITLPGTPENNRIFGDIFRMDRVVSSASNNIGVGFNPLRKASFEIFNELNEVLESGYIKLDSIARSKNGCDYNVTLYGGLGDFMYNLSYDGAGNKKTLADLDYLGRQHPEEEFDYYIDRTLVANAWTTLAGEEENELFETINFAPCYDGIPQNFDADKAVFDGSVYGYAGILRANLARAFTGMEAHDLRSYLLRPVIRVKKILEAIDDTYINGGYDVTYSQEVTQSVYYQNMWMTLPILSFKDGSAMKSGSFFTKADLLGGSMSPAEFLLSFCKMLGLKIICDKVSRKVNVMTRAEFFNAEVIDITKRIDLSGARNVIPVQVDTKWMMMASKDESELASYYRNTYGVGYGSQKINTGTDFNSDVKDITESILFKGGVQCQESSTCFRRVTRNGQDFPAVFLEGGTFTITSGGQSSEQNLISGNLTSIWWSNTPGMDVNDYVQLHKENNGAIGGENVLLFFRGMKDGSHLQLSDDIPSMGETPCWNFSSTDTRPLFEIPHFTRYIVEDGVVTTSLDWGTPRQIFLNGVTMPESASIYSVAWKDYLHDRFDANTRSVRCKVNLSGMQVNADIFRSFYWFGNSVWSLNRIINHSLTTFDPTECEFVKVMDAESYTEGSLPPVPPPPPPPTPPTPPADAGITYVMPSGTKSVGSSAGYVNFLFVTEPAGEEVGMSTDADFVDWDSRWNDLTYTANTTGHQRTAVLNFFLTNYPTAPGKQVTLIQEAASAQGVTSVTPSSLIVGGKAGSQAFSFATEPTGLSVNADLGDATWLTYNASTKTLSWGVNSARTSRSANVVFYVEGHRTDYMSVSMVITQAADYYLDIPDNTATMPYVGGERLFGYESNGTLRWATPVGSRIEVVSAADGLIKLRVSQNPSTEASDNIGSVTFWVEEDTAKTATITLAQAGISDYILVNPEKYVASSLGGVITVDLSTDVPVDNIDYTITGSGVTVRQITATSIRMFLSPNESHMQIDPKAVLKLFDRTRPRIETTLTIAQAGQIAPEPNRT